MPIILEGTAVCPMIGMAKAVPAPAAIFRNSRRFTSQLIMRCSLFCLVAADVDVFGFNTRGAVKIEFSHGPSVGRASGNRRRIRLQMKVTRGGVHKMRIEKTGMM